jgi:hypothetical protein
MDLKQLLVHLSCKGKAKPHCEFEILHVSYGSREDSVDRTLYVLACCALQASGFCYINDIVLAILELLKYHRCVERGVVKRVNGGNEGAGFGAPTPWGGGDAESGWERSERQVDWGVGSKGGVCWVQYMPGPSLLASVLFCSFGTAAQGRVCWMH